MQNNRYGKSDSFLLPFQGLINGRGMTNYKHHDHRKKNVKTPIIELEKRLNFGVWKVRPSLRHLLGYNSACFFFLTQRLLLHYMGHLTKN